MEADPPHQSREVGKYYLPFPVIRAFSLPVQAGSDAVSSAT
jgi:hypothetical protein